MPPPPEGYRELRRVRIGDLGDAVISQRPHSDPADRGKRYAVEFEIGDGGDVIDFAEIGERLGTGAVPTFKEGSYWAATEKIGVVFLAPIREAFSDPREMFCLFHELGHLISYRKARENGRTRFWELGSSDQAAWQRMRLENEKEAWDEALEVARVIQRDFGVDFLSLFRDRNEFEDWVRDGKLETYERRLAESESKTRMKT